MSKIELKPGMTLQSTVNHAMRICLCHNVSGDTWTAEQYRLTDNKWKWVQSIFVKLDPKETKNFWEVVEE